jgi:hypothetical protein
VSAQGGDANAESGEEAAFESGGDGGGTGCDGSRSNGKNRRT